MKLEAFFADYFALNAQECKLKAKQSALLSIYYSEWNVQLASELEKLEYIICSFYGSSMDFTIRNKQVKQGSK